MIKNILFDVDGVLLSEERYFDASALTVWELLASSHYLGMDQEGFSPQFSDPDITRIRKEVFYEDQILQFLKSRGLNANWDMIYITFSFQLIHLLSQIRKEEQKNISRWLSGDITRVTLREIGEVLSKYSPAMDFKAFLPAFEKSTATKQDLTLYLNDLAKKKLQVDTNIFRGQSALWSVCEHVSQEWYVGDEHVEKSTGRPSVQSGKKGFLSEEKPLAEPEEIAGMFSSLLEKGLSIGIGTGRPELETIEPFRTLGWLDLFNRNKIVTADDVLKTERIVNAKDSLSKPHPFTYVYALSEKQDARHAVNLDLPLPDGDETLIVGDSLADLLAARKMGCRFAAVLTGLSGQDARREFEEQGADYIVNTVLEVEKVLKN